MNNFVFISPNFPENYRYFCRELNENGMNVLGIGDQPYDELSFDLKEALREYYKVGSLEDYDQVYRAVAFFAFKYGRIDWIESNNEYWLENDAKLRTDFNVTTGFKLDELPYFTRKSLMKQSYEKAGIPAARFCLPESLEDALSFTEEVGFPVVVKPDRGVGASHTFRLKNEKELEDFWMNKPSGITFIMEEYVYGDIISYDAIIGSSGDVIFETGNVTPGSIMDIVNEQKETAYYIRKELPENVRAAGRAAVKSFGVKSRFIHFEFFCLTKDQGHLGRKGDVVALEANMRPSGGFSTDMMNFAHSTDVYKIWADMVSFGRTGIKPGKHAFCAFLGRRDGRDYLYSDDVIIGKYSEEIRLMQRMPDALSDDMGNRAFLAVFDTLEEVNGFFEDCTKRV